MNDEPTTFDLPPVADGFEQVAYAADEAMREVLAEDDDV